MINLSFCFYVIFLLLRIDERILTVDPLEASLHAYLEGAGLTTDDKGSLFRSLAGKTGC